VPKNVPRNVSKINLKGRAGDNTPHGCIYMSLEVLGVFEFVK